MKSLYAFLFLLFALPLTTQAIEEFPVTIDAFTDTSVTLSTSRFPKLGEYYNASCSPYTGKEESEGFTTLPTVVVPNLTKGTIYTCRINIFPASGGGQIMGMSEEIRFTAGTSITLTNKKPSITKMVSSFANATAKVGEETEWTVTANDPEGDTLYYRFWVCKRIEASCIDAMNGAPDGWYDSVFHWTPKETGNYTIKVHVRDAHHETASATEGDVSESVDFTVFEHNSTQTTNTSINQIPIITDIQYRVDSHLANGQTQMMFTATATDPENDPVMLKFWVCKYDGTICNNAMNTAKEEWTTEKNFQWIAPSGGNFQVQVIARDGKHTGEENPFGDDEESLSFVLYGKEPNIFTVGISTPPAGFEAEVITSPAMNPFPDTTLTSLVGKAAAELYRRAVIGGYADGKFKGDRSVNRAEAAKFLLLARFGSVEDIQNSGTFFDVVDGQWYTKFVVTAAKKGIIKGYADGSFRPANTVNTAEFLKMLTLTFGLEENTPYTTYMDIDANAWYTPYAGIAEQYQLFPERKGKLQPEKNLTRAEVAIAIYQYLSQR